MPHHKLKQGATVVALMCSAIAFGGCGRDGAKPVEPSVTTPPSRPKELGRPISEKEAAELAQSIVDAIRNGDLATFTRLFDFDSLMEIGTAGVEAEPKIRAAFAKGARGRWVGTGGFADQIIKSCQNGGSYDLLRVRKRDHYRSMLMRLTMPNGEGVSYQEFLLARENDGRIKIVDCYAYFSGENLSTTIRRGFIEVAANSNRNLLERLTGSERDFVKYAQKIQEVTSAIRNGQQKQALTLIRQLPPSLQQNKLLFLMRIQAAQTVDEREYEKAVGEFRTAFPEDPCVDMLSIDYHTLRKDYSQALACIDRLDQSVGGDPHLEVQRAGIHSLSEDYEAALRDLDRLIEKEPAYVAAYWSKVAITLTANRYDETLNLLKTIRTKFSLEPGDMTKTPEYKGFIASPQYKEWLAWLKQEQQSLSPKR